MVKILAKNSKPVYFFKDGLRSWMIWPNTIYDLAKSAMLLFFFRSNSKHDPTFSLLIGFKGNT